MVKKASKKASKRGVALATVAALTLSGVYLPGMTEQSPGKGAIVVAQAQENPASDFKINRSKCEITGYVGTATDVVIPSEIEGMPVYSIGEEAFSEYYNNRDNGLEITSVVIPDSVLTIGEYAFYKCSKLETVTLPSKLKSIGSSAFSNCVSLKSVKTSGTSENEIPDTVPNKLPNTVEKIGKYAFYNCSSELKSLMIPYNAKEIGDYAIGYSHIGYYSNAIKPDFTLYYYPNTPGETYAQEWKNKANKDYVTANSCNIQALHIDISQTVVTLPVTSFEYTGGGINPAVTVTYAGKTLKEGTDYSLTYKNNTNIGTGTVTITGLGTFTGTMEKTFTIQKKSLARCKVSYGKSRSFTGKAVGTTVSVSDGTTALVEGRDYGITYENNVNVGKAKVIITGLGNYSKTVKKSFKIIPATPKVKVSSRKKKSIKIKWNKVKQASGYSVYQYNGNTRKWKVVKTQKTSYTAGKLKAGTTYKFKVKAYTKIAGKDYVSAGSKLLKVSTKK